jgi:hypothetical protein
MVNLIQELMSVSNATSLVPQLPLTYEKPPPRTSFTKRDLKVRIQTYCMRCEDRLVKIKCFTCEREYCGECNVELHLQLCRRRSVH